MHILSRFLYTDRWAIHIWKTTHKMYKDILKLWYKGTGGGSGLSKEFETWNTSKYEKYGIDPDNYDHTDISSRPAILLNLYSGNRQPFLTVIHLWDKLCDGLLASKHNPLKIGRGEPGVTSQSSISTISSVNTSTSTRQINLEDSQKSFSSAVKSFMDMCNTQNGSSKEKRNKEAQDYQNMDIDELYKLVEYQKNHLLFLKEMNMLTESEKTDSCNKIQKLNAVIGTKAGLSTNNSNNNMSH